MALLQLEEPGEDGVAVVTLDRPDKKNALSIALRDEISDAVDRLAADDRLRALVVTGSGTVFCPGFDLDEFAVDDPAFQERLWASSDRYHRTVLAFPLPVVAALNGPAIAGGFDLAVLADIRIAVPGCWFAHPERTFGDVVYGPLQDLVGGALARELALTGRRIGAEEARACHLVAEIVDADELRDRALEVARVIAETPRDILVRMKRKIVARSGIDPASATLAL